MNPRTRRLRRLRRNAHRIGLPLAMIDWIDQEAAKWKISRKTLLQRKPNSWWIRHWQQRELTNSTRFTIEFIRKHPNLEKKIVTIINSKMNSEAKEDWVEHECQNALHNCTPDERMEISRYLHLGGAIDWHAVGTHFFRT